MVQSLWEALHEALPTGRRERGLLVAALVVCAVCQVAAISLATQFAAWVSPSDEADAVACPATGGQIGWVQAPATLSEAFPGKGETWTLAEDRPVRKSHPDGAIVCVLPAGSRFVVLDVPVEDEGQWVPVVAEAILSVPEAPIAVAAEVVAEEPVDVAAVADSEPADPDQLGGLCPGPRGTIVGYVRLNGPFLISQGATWTVMSKKDVMAGRPRAENKWKTTFSTVCRLPRGARVTVHQKPVRIPQKGLWLPVYAGAAWPPS